MKKLLFLMFVLCPGWAYARDVIVPSGTITLADDDMEVVELVLEKGTKGHWYFHADGRKYRVSDATSEDLFDVAMKKAEKNSSSAILAFIYSDESEWRKKTMFFFFRRDDRQWHHRRNSDTPVGRSPQQEQNPLGILLEGILKGNR